MKADGTLGEIRREGLAERRDVDRGLTGRCRTTLVT
jgi:hypothetical protein